jgi:superfamily II DNA or RNA helicase
VTRPDKQAKRQERLKQRQASERRRAARIEAGLLCGEADYACHAGDDDEALRLTRKALAHDAGCSFALELVARICFDRKDYEAAALIFRRCRSREPHPLSAYYCGVANLCLNRLQESAADLREALRLIESGPRAEWKDLHKNAAQCLNYVTELIAERAGVKARAAESSAGSAAAVTGSRQNMASAAAAAPAPSPATPPAAAPRTTPQQPEPPRISVEILVAPPPAFATAGRLADYELRRRLERLRLAQSFEDLICLSTLNGVDSYEHQHQTARKVLQQFKGRALLADEVGLGKTIEACLVLKEYWLRGLVCKALVLVPPSLVAQWTGELREKFGFSPVSPDGAEFRRDPAAFWSREPLVVASMAQARLDPHAGLLAAVPWDMVIVDEAHCLKNRASANWKLVNTLQKKFILMLTATPVENHLIELHNLITVLKPGLLSTEAEFRRKFITPASHSKPKDPARLRELLSEVMVRNTRAAVNVQLPPRIASVVVVSPSPEEERLYEMVSAFVRERYAPARERMALKWLQRQAGSSPEALSRALGRALSALPDDAGEGAPLPALDDSGRRELEDMQELAAQVRHSAKGTRLVEMLAARPGKTVVFTEFAATLEHLARVAHEHSLRYAVFSGDMSRAEKDAAIAHFRDEAQVLLSTGAGGEGRNLQFADTVINFDLPWNPMRLEQRVGRVHRIGQNRRVFVFNFCQARTLEEQLLRVLHDKISMFELVVGEMDAVLATFGEDTRFSDLVLELWLSAADDAGRIAAFDQLGEKLIAAKSQYVRTKQLDDALFEQDFQA